MAYFRPIDTTMDEEQVQLCRKEKLRCACPPTLTLQQAGGAGQGTSAPPSLGKSVPITAPVEDTADVSLPLNRPMTAASQAPLGGWWFSGDRKGL